MSDSEKEMILITLDGGAAVGKSSAAACIAERLDLLHVDTGAHYRTVTHRLLQLSPDLELGIETSSAIRKSLEAMVLTTEGIGRRATLQIDGQTASDAQLRNEAINKIVSQVAAIPEARARLLTYQRSQVNVAAENGFQGLVVEGRDIGSVIFPEAAYRFFLTADATTRAARRADEGITDSITTRDHLDSTRKNAPLVCPEGAVTIDTTHNDLEAVVEMIIAAVCRK